MGYEVYEHLFEPSPEAGFSTLEEFRSQVQSLASEGVSRRTRARLAVSDRVRMLTARVHRGGLDASAFDAMIEEHSRDGGTLNSADDRLSLVERIVMKKASSQGKANWGVKIASNYRDILNKWPESRVLFMLRDGRDIAASRKLNGNFRQTMTEVAAAYVKQVRKFQALLESHPENAKFVSYEDLVDDLEGSMRPILEFLQLPWSDEVLSHEQQKLTLLDAPAGHLSAKQVSRSVNASSVGRWQKDLSLAEVEEFHIESAELLEELGFETSSPRGSA